MVSLLELTWGDGWGESAFVSLDWDAIPRGYPEVDFSDAKGSQVAGVWYCRPPAVASFIAKTQSGLFVLDWFSEDPEAQFLRNTHYIIYCYSYNLLERNLGFAIYCAPNPANWSPRESVVGIRNPRNPFLKGKPRKVRWVRLRP